MSRTKDEMAAEITAFCNRVIEDASLKAEEAEGHALLAGLEDSREFYTAEQLRSYGEAMKALGEAKGAAEAAQAVAIIVARNFG